MNTTFISKTSIFIPFFTLGRIKDNFIKYHGQFSICLINFYILNSNFFDIIMKTKAIDKYSESPKTQLTI